MNSVLEQLRANLQATFDLALRLQDGWGDHSMAKTLEEVRERHESPAAPVNERTVAMAVSSFRRTGQPERFNDLKYVCLGAATDDGGGWCILADEALRGRLFTLAETVGDSRRQLKCFQSLLRSYWGFRLNAPETGKTSLDGWLVLREWLARRLTILVRTVARKPEWFSTLSIHANLLTGNPCDRYGPALLQGDGSELQQAVVGLAIPTDSWVMEEAIFAQMKSAATLRHDEFQAVLPQLIDIAGGRAGVSVSKILAQRCIALLVSRYARCATMPEQMALRDAAVSIIGNPWLRRPSWDAAVLDDKGRPDDVARDMVNGWLKRRLIGDFFELFSADSTGATRRRLDYWLRFEPFIEDMWFVLGVNAREKRGEIYDDFRNRAKGRLLDLDQTTADNNAFIMRIGEYLAVEFGAKGNALYLFRWDTLPSTLAKKLTLGQGKSRMSIHSLKSSIREERPIHRDSSSAGLT